jgi:predicted MPP superfamily phosphohydrolase
VCQFITNDSAVMPLDLVVHQGDIAYASTAVTVDDQGRVGVESDDDPGGEQQWVWDLWFQLIEPFAAKVPYVAGVGNHEKFHNFSSYLTRFRNPAPWGGQSSHLEDAVFWFSFDYGLVHFTMISTEHDYYVGSPQYTWIQADLQKAAANRKTVPWIILVGHRPMYSSDSDEQDQHWPGAPYQSTIEPLLVKYSVDMTFSGHMHMYERVHAVINGTVKQASDIHGVYRQPGAPIHVVQGNAGIFEDTKYIDPQPAWSAKRLGRIGYGRMQVFNATHLFYESRELATEKTMDEFWLIRG